MKIKSGAIVAGLMLLAGAILGTATFLPPAPAEQVVYLKNNPNRYERAQAGTAFIETDDGYGSGIAFKRGNKTFVFTAAHVVRGFDHAKVGRILHATESKGKLLWTGYVIARFIEVDTAILYVDCPPETYYHFEWAETETSVGSEVFLVGNFKGPDFDGSVAKGIVSQLGIVPERIAFPWKLTDQADFVVYSGASGGPVIRTSDDTVIGILVGATESGSSVSFYIPIREIRKVAESQGFSFLVHADDRYPSDALLHKLIDANKIEPVVIIPAK